MKSLIFAYHFVEEIFSARPPRPHDAAPQAANGCLLPGQAAGCGWSLGNPDMGSDTSNAGGGVSM